MKSLAKSLFIGLVTLMIVVAPASAQRNKAPVILFIDQTKLVATSKAGQSIAEQLRRLNDEAAAELQQIGQQLVAEQRALREAQGTMSEEDFGKRLQAYAQQERQAAQLEQLRKAELAQAENRAVAKMNEQLTPIVRQILDRRNATVVIEKRAVYYADDEMDITDEIVVELDKKLKTVKVDKVDLLAEAAAQQAAAQAN